MRAIAKSLFPLLVATLMGCASGGRPGPAPDPLEPRAEAWAAFLAATQAHEQGRLREAAELYERAAELDPDSAELPRHLAAIWAQLGDLERAAPHAARALELAPDDHYLRVSIARLYVNLERLEEAAALLEPLLEQMNASSGSAEEPLGEIEEQVPAMLFALYARMDRIGDAERVAHRIMELRPEDVRAHLALGVVYERAQRWDDAIALYRRGLEIDPGREALYDYLARVHRARGDSGAELAVLEEKLVAVDDDRRALGRIAEIHEEAGDREQARDALEALVDAHPDLVLAQLRLGAMLYEMQELEAAEERFRSVLESAVSLPQPVMLHQGQYFLGLVLADREAYDEALELLEEIPATSVRFPDARRLRAWIHERRGDLPSAVVDARQALAASDDPRRIGVFLARLYQRSQDMDAAIGVMTDLISEYPDDVELIYDLGVIHGEAREMERSLELMNEVLVREPDHSRALNYVGYSWAERGERLDEAERMIRRAVELQPDDGYIIDSLGWVLYQRGLQKVSEGEAERARALFREAIEQLELALAKLDRRDPIITWHLGDAYRSVSRFREALRSYQEALELGPGEEEAAKIRAQIELLELQLRDGGAGAPR